MEGTLLGAADEILSLSCEALEQHASSHLMNDRNRLLLRMRVFGRDVLTTFDTGANGTDLNANFADTFPQAVQGAKKWTTDITGVGGTQTFDSK
jgi:hypothetical protein